MKHHLILLACLLICWVPPAGALSVGVSSVGGPPDAPTENVSYYIGDAKAAIAGYNWTYALLLTTRGIAYYPDNPDLLSLQGYTFLKMGQYTKSVEVASKAILLDPKPVRYANRGYGYLALGNYSAALADAQAGISLNTTYATNYGVKALALQGMGRNSEALGAIDQAFSLEPENAHFWHVDGVLLAAGGNCTGAKDALERSLAINPEYTLPYPGFKSARENLETLNTICIPAAVQSPAHPSPTKSSSGCIAITGCLCAGLIFMMRKK